ncbi:MAG: bifunctional chorismate mutase/prephenate dehydratase [Candidatus Delongbacteria bacterium]|nr:bifunctional chorismate mutase/prephenate dehydratase [Candidatus Delongbacteria bacterium]
MLQQIRDQIDRLDNELLKLLDQRMQLSLKAKRCKNEVEDKIRESEVLEKVKNYPLRLIDKEFCEKLFVDIIAESKRIQHNEYDLIGFQGEHGAYGEVAAGQWDNTMIPIPCPEFADVFNLVSDGVLEYGIVPVENTLGGVVGEVNELLLETNLVVVGEIELPIRHCLLTLPETDHREIRTIYSHTQALAQCRNFLIRNKLEPKPYYDTAGAARMLSTERPKASAAIASNFCADLYNLEILKEDIQDHTNNITRFLILAREKQAQPGNKCSIVFSTCHKAGTLFKVLEDFAMESINLTRIESFPSDPGEYAFFLDFLGSDQSEPVRRILDKLQQDTSQFKLLGCYQERKVQ